MMVLGSTRMQHLVTSELERVVKVHLADGVATGRVRVERPFHYRFSFEDLGTIVDCLVGVNEVVTTTTKSPDKPHATMHLSAAILARFFILARQSVFDVEAFAAAGFTMAGDLDLHGLVLALVGGAPSHFLAALDTIDRTCTSDLLDPHASSAVEHLVHTTLEETEGAARRALRSSRPLLVHGFPFSWVGLTREDFLASYGDLELWVDGRLIPLRIYAEGGPDERAPEEAYSPVSPTDAVYATNLVAPEPITRGFGSPLFEERCGRLRVFGGRSVLPDATAWARVTSAHRHAHEVVVWQVFGKKKWVLVPPAHRAPLELRPLGFETQFCGVLDPDVVDDVAFRKAATTIVMDPGDLLVLPGGWFHVTYVTREPALGFSSFAELLRF
jgi:hypothetical protein